jgi:hypothetical protein
LRLFALGAALVFQALATGAHASTYTVTVSPNIDIGTVTSGTVGDTLFRIDPNSGGVTVLSGSGLRSGAGTTRAMVTIACQAVAPGDCTKTVNVRLGVAGSPTKRARSLVRIVFALGTATLAGSPGAPGAPTFTIGAIGPNASKTFWIGADLGVAGDDSGLATGDAESDFFVFAAESPGTPTTGDIGRAQVRVIRSLAIAKTSDMIFGKVIKPGVGAGTVSLDPVTGARTVTGGTGVDTPIPTRAAFNVTGEGGQAFSIAVPASFQMNGPQTLTVTTTSSAGASAVLSSTLGSMGSFTLGVGGSLPITSSMLTGDYSGMFTVTVAYN